MIYFEFAKYLAESIQWHRRHDWLRDATTTISAPNGAQIGLTLEFYFNRKGNKIEISFNPNTSTESRVPYNSVRANVLNFLETAMSEFIGSLGVFAKFKFVVVYDHNHYSEFHSDEFNHVYNDFHEVVFNSLKKFGKVRPGKDEREDSYIVQPFAQRIQKSKLLPTFGTDLHDIMIAKDHVMENGNQPHDVLEFLKKFNTHLTELVRDISDRLRTTLSRQTRSDAPLYTLERSLEVNIWQIQQKLALWDHYQNTPVFNKSNIDNLKNYYRTIATDAEQILKAIDDPYKQRPAAEGFQAVHTALVELLNSIRKVNILEFLDQTST